MEETFLMPLIRHLAENMKGVELVDEDYGQLEMIDDENRDTYPLVFPSVLVDAPDTSWDNIRGLSQKGLATVRVRLLVDCYDDTHASSGTVRRIEEREVLRRRLHSLVQGFRAESWTTGLVRVSSRFYTYNHGIKVYEASYTAEVTEMLRPDTTAIPGSSVRITIENGRMP